MIRSPFREQSIREIERSVNLIVDTNSENGTDILIEVSGNVGLEAVRNIAEYGVDYISIGALTHSVRNHDFTLLFNEL